MADTSFTHKPDITLDVHRCWDCGSYWAVEKRVVSLGRCPVCASRKIEEAEDREKHANLRASALRGALTRLKAKWGRRA